MRNEIIYDAAGIPDIMVTFTPDELGLPSILKGRKVAEYLIGKYQATLINGVPHALPYQEPALNVDHDETIRLCEAKGPGWHLFTNDEWAALARWSWEHDLIPTGNTDNGQSHSHPEQTGTAYEGGCGRTLTGSGPIEWNHDRTALGIADMVGNIAEHVGGVRFLNGQVQIIPDNEAAAGADQSKDSKEWTTVCTPDKNPVYFNPIYIRGSEEIFLQYHEATVKTWGNTPFTNLRTPEIDVPDKLIELGLYPAAGYNGTDWCSVCNEGVRVLYRGGHCRLRSGAGMFCFRSSYHTNSDEYAGFRPAFVRYSEDA